MLLGYIDESYDDDDYWLTALLVPDADHASLSKRLREIAAKAVTAHGLDSSAEFRGYDVFHGEREWAPLKAAPRQRIGIYKAVLDAVAQAQGKERERPDLDTSRLIDTVHFIRSHESVLVQAADMVGFIHRRASARRERDSRAEATNRLLTGLIEPLVIARRRWPDQPLI